MVERVARKLLCVPCVCDGRNIINDIINGTDLWLFTGLPGQFRVWCILWCILWSILTILHESFKKNWAWVVDFVTS